MHHDAKPYNQMHSQTSFVIFHACEFKCMTSKTIKINDSSSLVSKTDGLTYFTTSPINMVIGLNTEGCLHSEISDLRYVRTLRRTCIDKFISLLSVC